VLNFLSIFRVVSAAVGADFALNYILNSIRHVQQSKAQVEAAFSNGTVERLGYQLD